MSASDVAGELPHHEGQFVLGVDLDGVVADYLAGFTEYLTQRGRLTADALVQRSRYDFSEWGLTHDEYESLHAEAVVQASAAGAPPGNRGRRRGFVAPVRRWGLDPGDHPSAVRELGPRRGGG